MKQYETLDDAATQLASQIEKEIIDGTNFSTKIIIALNNFRLTQERVNDILESDLNKLQARMSRDSQTWQRQRRPYVTNSSRTNIQVSK